MRRVMKFIDIGANLTDSMFRGIYGGKPKHTDDFHRVLGRSWSVGVQKIIITVGSNNEIQEAVDVAKSDSERLFITLGVHPTRCNEFEAAGNPESYFQTMCHNIERHRTHIVALGEMGLDYDRLHFCEKETQKKYFEKQLSLCSKYTLPLFLHSRNAHKDFVEIIRRNLALVSACGGVVHSFDGSLEEGLELIELGFHIGINGCSLKTAENLEVVKQLPVGRLMVETDAPWCGIRPTHASFKHVKTKFETVKKKEKWTENSLIDGRNEPCQIVQVVEAISAIRDEPSEQLADQIYSNTMKLFFPDV